MAISALSASILLASAAQLLFRWCMKTLTLNQHGSVFSILGAVAAAPPPQLAMLVTGAVLYACSMLCWIVALTRLQLSLAYPLMSLSYVVVYIAAVTIPVFEEAASIQSISAVSMILLGAVLVGARQAE